MTVWPSCARRSLLPLNGRPNGLLLDIGALQASTLAPASVGAPLSISRVQSAYWAADAASSTLVITFTVTEYTIAGRRPGLYCPRCRPVYVLGSVVTPDILPSLTAGSHV